MPKLKAKSRQVRRKPKPPAKPSTKAAAKAKLIRSQDD
jgi:hypothetical protein